MFLKSIVVYNRYNKEITKLIKELKIHWYKDFYPRSIDVYCYCNHKYTYTAHQILPIFKQYDNEYILELYLNPHSFRTKAICEEISMLNGNIPEEKIREEKLRTELPLIKQEELKLDMEENKKCFYHFGY